MRCLMDHPVVKTTAYTMVQMFLHGAPTLWNTVAYRMGHHPMVYPCGHTIPYQVVYAMERTKECPMEDLMGCTTEYPTGAFDELN